MLYVFNVKNALHVMEIKCFIDNMLKYFIDNML